MTAIDWLLTSKEPGVVVQVKRDLLGERDPPEAARVLDGPWVRDLLAGQRADGGFGVGVYGKWGGAHWRLVSLVLQALLVLSRMGSPTMRAPLTPSSCSNSTASRTAAGAPGRAGGSRPARTGATSKSSTGAAPARASW